MLELKSVSLSFGDRVLLSEIDWQVPEGSRVALVGANGTGKSTLLKIIAGEMESDQGQIIQSANDTLGYLPQDLVELESIPLINYLRAKSGLTRLEKAMKETHHQMAEYPPDSQEYKEAVNRYSEALKHYEHIGGYDYDSRAGKILSGLGFSETEFKKDCLEFSGGWKMRIQLAHILLSEPDLMILDEPTNHLDTESMEWLEGFLTAYRGTLIAVSHDRRFLDKMMTTTAELSRGHLALYPGNYSYYLEQKELRQKQLEAEARRQNEYIERTNQFIDRFRYKATKAAQVQSRIKQLEKIEKIELETREKKVRIKFPEPPKCAFEIIKVEKLSHGYDGLPVLDNISFNLRQGEKIALVGVNGAGKSTLSRLVSRKEEPNKGKVIWGKGVSMGFFAQESRLNLDYSKTIWEEISTIETSVPAPQVRSLLGAFLFSGDDLFKPIEVLSGGEKSRLALCKLLLEKHNLLILDEPTNHLDMATRDIFQEALMHYKGALILVSHDRHFLDQLISRVIEIKDHQAHLYMGNYTEFIKKRAQLLSKANTSGASFQSQISLSESSLSLEPEEEATPSKSLWEQQKDRKRKEAILRKELADYKKKIQSMEKEIHSSEEEKAQIEKTLCDPDLYASDPEKIVALTTRRKVLEDTLRAVYEKWDQTHKQMNAREKEMAEDLSLETT